jgi:site-specific recombinase XerD
MNEIIRVSNAGDYQLIAQSTTEDMIVTMWLNRPRKSNSESTRRQYRRCYKLFTEQTGKGLQEITYNDLLSWSNGLRGSQNTRKVTIAAVKSLFSFAQKLGYLRVNPAVMIDSPAVKDKLAERILTEEEVLTMIHRTSKQRDNVLIRLLYASAARISEVCALHWGDVQPNGNSGQVTLFGKGGKTRAVKLSVATWKALQGLRAGAANDAPLFVSQKGGPLDSTQVHRIVKAAAVRAGVSGNVSAHWLRHSHASHALDRGANVALVRDTLGHSSLETTSRYTHAKPSESSATYLSI